MILKIKIILKLLVIIFVCIITSLLIISFFFISKKKEGFNERKYKNARKSQFYQPKDPKMIATNAGIIAAIAAASHLSLGIGAAAAIALLKDKIINVYDPKNERALRYQVMAVHAERDFYISQQPIVDNSINIITSTINGHANQIKSYSKTLEKSIEKINTQLPSVYNSATLLNPDPNVSMIGNIHANLQDLRVYLNMIINENVLNNMKKDIKNDAKSKFIINFLMKLSTDINSKLVNINSMINDYVPVIIPKSTPKDVNAILSDFNNMKPIITKILDNNKLLNTVVLNFSKLVSLKNFYVKEIKANIALDKGTLQPFKRRKFKNAKW